LFQTFKGKVLRSFCERLLFKANTKTLTSKCAEQNCLQNICEMVIPENTTSLFKRTTDREEESLENITFLLHPHRPTPSYYAYNKYVSWVTLFFFVFLTIPVSIELDRVSSARGQFHQPSCENRKKIPIPHSFTIQIAPYSTSAHNLKLQPTLCCTQKTAQIYWRKSCS